MTGRRFEPISRKLPGLIHGCDYNPEQWLHQPEVLREDLPLMRKALCNTVTVGIFAWSVLEPEEGRYEFGWLDRVMEELWSAGIAVILATPSAGRPAWLARAYPEVLRMDAERRRDLQGTRARHCYTSPVYRQKVQAINRRLAERYGKHPALILWHLSNEYNGECHCPLCQEAFRLWLRQRYGDSLERLNQAWWTAFWSHSYSDWSQVESPAPNGQRLLNGLILDWKRFVTEQTADFMRAELAPLRENSPGIPVTTNLMGAYRGLDYRRLAVELDVASWDSYPCWHAPDREDGRPGAEWITAADTAFWHSLVRRLKAGRPFLLMESTPTFSNWHAVHKLKRPGLHRLSSLLAVAHGSDSVQYFQWRKSRGGYEKFHGAVVDHGGGSDSRVFHEVAEVGEILKRLEDVAGSGVPAETALLFDWENWWALEEASGLSLEGEKGYWQTCLAHHRPFWSLGLPVDVIGPEEELGAYRLVIAPMLYLLRPGVAEGLERFVKGGGTLVSTYWSGIANETDLCFLGGFPGPLRMVLGIRSEELDSLYPQESNRVVPRPGNELGLAGEYRARHFCDLVRLESARALAEYGEDFYRGLPALTVNDFGRGRAYYLASWNEEPFLQDFYRALSERLGLRRALEAPLPRGVSAQLRADGKNEYLFLLNFTQETQELELGSASLDDLLSGRATSGKMVLPPYGLGVLRRASG
jgi:beta-galactosidase